MSTDFASLLREFWSSGKWIAIPVGFIGYVGFIYSISLSAALGFNVDNSLSIPNFFYIGTLLIVPILELTAFLFFVTLILLHLPQIFALLLGTISLLQSAFLRGVIALDEALWNWRGEPRPPKSLAARAHRLRSSLTKSLWLLENRAKGIQLTALVMGYLSRFFTTAKPARPRPAAAKDAPTHPVKAPVARKKPNARRNNHGFVFSLGAAVVVAVLYGTATAITSAYLFRGEVLRLADDIVNGKSILPAAAAVDKPASAPVIERLFHFGGGAFEWFTGLVDGIHHLKPTPRLVVVSTTDGMAAPWPMILAAEVGETAVLYDFVAPGHPIRTIDRSAIKKMDLLSRQAIMEDPDARFEVLCRVAQCDRVQVSARWAARLVRMVGFTCHGVGELDTANVVPAAFIDQQVSMRQPCGGVATPTPAISPAVLVQVNAAEQGRGSGDPLGPILKEIAGAGIKVTLVTDPNPEPRPPAGPPTAQSTPFGLCSNLAPRWSEGDRQLQFLKGKSAIADLLLVPTSGSALGSSEGAAARAKEILDRWESAIKEKKDSIGRDQSARLVVYFFGRASSDGPRPYNYEVSEKRAKVIQQLAEGRESWKGLGVTVIPVATGDSLLLPDEPPASTATRRVEALLCIVAPK